MIDLTDRLDDLSVRDLLAGSIGFPTEARIQEVCDRYATQGNWRLMGVELNGALTGCVGVELLDGGSGQVRHISVQPEEQRKGIGRAMLDHIRDHFQLENVTAVTDSDAVGFWLRCGFNVESLGEQYPGVERFNCTPQVAAIDTP